MASKFHPRAGKWQAVIGNEALPGGKRIVISARGLYNNTGCCRTERGKVQVPAPEGWGQASDQGIGEKTKIDTDTGRVMG